MDYNNMSNDQLKSLIVENYRKAVNEGVIRKLSFIAEKLGENLNANYGTKYRYKLNGMEIFVDNWGGYMTVVDHNRKKTILSTHYCDCFIIIDDRIENLLAQYPDALEVSMKKKANDLNREKQLLLSKLPDK